MINKNQIKVALKKGWTVEETEDGLVLNYSVGNLFEIFNYYGLTKLWLEEDENLLDTICRYRRQYGYGETFINKMLDEDICVVEDLRRDGVSYRDMVLGLEEYDAILEDLFVGLDELTR